MTSEILVGPAEGPEPPIVGKPVLVEEASLELLLEDLLDSTL